MFDFKKITFENFWVGSLRQSEFNDQRAPIDPFWSWGWRGSLGFQGVYKGNCFLSIRIKSKNSFLKNWSTSVTTFQVYIIDLSMEVLGLKMPFTPAWIRSGQELLLLEQSTLVYFSLPESLRSFSRNARGILYPNSCALLISSQHLSYSCFE